MEPMNAGIKQLWLDALPHYTQATGFLRDGDTFCCLGVLCDIAEQDGVGRWEGETFKSNDCMSNQVLITPVIEWSGLNLNTGFMNFDDRHGLSVSLTSANDGGCTFAQIADLIKAFF